MLRPWLTICRIAPDMPCGVQGEDAQHDETQVADRGISDQFLHVLLRIGDERAVDDADDRQALPSTAQRWTVVCGKSGRLKRRKP